MIATGPGADTGATLHLVAPPSWSPRDHRPSSGRLVPSLLAAHALRDRAPTGSGAPATTLVTIGDTDARAGARLAWLEPDLHAAPVLGRLRPLVRRLARLAAGRERVVCWSDELLPLAARLGIPCTLVSTAPHEIPPGAPRPERVLVADACDLDHWETPAARLERDLARGIEHGSTAREGRAALRGAMEIPDDALLLGALEDNPSRVDARQFAFMLGLLSVTGYKVMGLVPRASARMTQALRHHEGLGRPFRFLIAEDPVTALLPALDACIVNPGHVSGSSVLMSQLIESAGVRVIDLSVTGRRGFSRSQRVASKILDQIDSIAPAAPAPERAQNPGAFAGAM